MNIDGAGGHMNADGVGVDLNADGAGRDMNADDAGADMDGAGEDAREDANAARAAITSWPMRSRYISCHARAKGSIFSMSAIKIFDS